MFLGVDYYPEQWDLEMLETDIDNIVEMGANTIRIGEFAWHLMEKIEGQYDFSFFDYVIKKAKEKNLKVIFGTPTATLPAWLNRKHPEVMGVSETGKRHSFGGRRQYCFNSDIYIDYCKKIIVELAKHFKDETAIAAWQIDNEVGHEGSDMCFCESCHKKFQNYLREKYVDIDQLNKKWGTIFWSQTYNDFDEIPMPTATITTHNPSLRLEYERFRSNSIESFVNFQVKLLKEILGENSIVFHDFSGGFWDKRMDLSKVATNLDVVAYNNYPVWGGLREPVPDYETAANLDFIRGLKNQNFWITEQIIGAQGHDVIGYLPRPNQAKMWSYQSLAHGCSSLIYFRYRAATFGAEQFCYGIIDHDNKKRRKFYEAQSFFNEVADKKELLNVPIDSDVAIVYDFDSMAAWRIQPQTSVFDFKKELFKFYKLFYNYNVNVDIIPSTSDFSKYKLVVIPNMMVNNSDMEERLKQYVKNGGIAVCSYRFSLKNQYNTIALGKELPVGYTDFIGAVVSDIESFQDNQYCDIKSLRDGHVSKGEVWRDILECTTAEIVYEYVDKFFESRPAITCNEYGDGRVYYFGTSVQDEVIQDVLSPLIREKKVSHFITPRGLEVRERKLDGKSYYFIMNHTEKEIIYKNLVFKPYDARIITD